MRRGLVVATLAITVAALAASVASQHLALSIGPLPEPHRTEPGIQWPPCPPLPSDAALVPTLSPVQEAEIYRTFLQDILKKSPGSPALYLRATTVIPEPPTGSAAESFWGYVCASVPSLDQTTLRSFRAQNERRGRLRTFFGLSVPYRLVGNGGSVRRALSQPVSSPYVFALSRAGLNDAATQALLYVEEDRGPGAAEGYFVLLARLGGVWRIQQRVPVWISVGQLSRSWAFLEGPRRLGEAWVVGSRPQRAVRTGPRLRLRDPGVSGTEGDAGADGV